MNAKVWRTALYCRLSREDGDRPESDSISNQRDLLTDYVAQHPEMEAVDLYIDDGYTGTNFDRPAFHAMLKDIEEGQVNCVLVKDLSRFGRDYIEAGRYLERWLPEHGTRFVAILDHIDSNRGAYDMMLPLKNLFNAQYAKDISQKVKSALHTKQQRGEFIGAFASYGYVKNPQRRNHLLIDPVAAQVVRRIFTLFEQGMGKVSIANLLNREGIPCPSEYKRMMGERYRNGKRLDRTTYWTYATVHRILQSEVYIGNLEQGRDQRLQLHGTPKRKEKAEWVIVEATHEAIIPMDQWNRVQALLSRTARTPLFSKEVSPFSGYLQCGDCGRSMAKTTWHGRTFYTCGSYKRYGATICSKHYISHDFLEQRILEDLNALVARMKPLPKLLKAAQGACRKADPSTEEESRLEQALYRVQGIKQRLYEDYREGVLSQEEYYRYRKDYDAQEKALMAQQRQSQIAAEEKGLRPSAWVEGLMTLGKLTTLDRATVAATIKNIRIYENQTIAITYLFSEEVRHILEGGNLR